MKLYYDLHIHSALSPCGSNDMTPNSLVGMAKLAGLDVIALCDHNSCKNTAAAVEAGKNYDIVVIPGMEICTVEEIHIVCLFPTVEKAMEFDALVEQNLQKVQNDSEVYGDQLILDSCDNITGNYPYLLTNATEISISNISELVTERGGVCFPAHIDRDSYSVLSVLGFLDSELGFTSFEIADYANRERIERFQPELFEEYFVLTSSDAHYLENIRDAERQIEVKERSAEAVIDYLRGKK